MRLKRRVGPWLFVALGWYLLAPPIQPDYSHNTAAPLREWYHGGAYHSDGCVLTYMTRWDESRKGWMVVSYRYPQRLVC